MTQHPPLRCGLIGCGMVANEYATTLAASPLVQLVACADRDPDRAQHFAIQHALGPPVPVEHLLNPEHVDLVVVLTPPSTHTQLARQVIAAGLPVYVEKPLGQDPAATAALLSEAGHAGLLLGAAPDTFLAPPVQAARAALDAGLIGIPIAAEAALLSTGPDRWHPAPEQFYALGAGPLGDMAPYYLTVLLYLLGPIIHVDAASATTSGTRLIQTGPRAGTRFPAQTPTHINALLRTAESVPVTFTASFDIAATSRPHLEIYGTDGTLVLPDPNFHEGPVRLRRRGTTRWQELAQPKPDLAPLGRGLGVLDLARAILHRTPHRATGQLAHQVVELITSINRAASRSPHRTSGTTG